MNKRPIPVLKRGGSRRVIKREPTKKTNSFNPELLFKDGKSTSIFPKRLSNYRFLICTDLSPEDMFALNIFTAWVKANQKFFEDRNNFPIYGFIVGNTENNRLKTQRAREYLKKFGELLGWESKDHHLYNNFNNAGKRIWYDKDMTGFTNEENLVLNTNALDDPDYPEPIPVEQGLEEIMKTKPNNLFIMYLKPLSFLKNLEQNPEVLEYLLKVPGTISELSDPTLLPLLNREKKDAPLLLVDKTQLMKFDTFITPDNSKPLFNELNDCDDDVSVFSKHTMICYNEGVFNSNVDLLIEKKIAESGSFEDVETFENKIKELNTTDTLLFSNVINSIKLSLKYNFQYINVKQQLNIIAMLLASSCLKNAPIYLQRVSIKDNDLINNESTNTFLLKRTDKEAVVLKYIGKLIQAALKYV